MSPIGFLVSLALVVAPHITRAQTPTGATSSAFTPLASKSFDWNNLPYKADTDTGVRGPQHGYNRCNSTTENQQSLCQTAVINSIEDFCIWAPPTGPTTIGETEHEAVAWCTKPGRGTRLIPAGALQGVQFMRTPDYIQVVGFIDQTKTNLRPDDAGGEMDPHGADLRGNPLGGLVYSTAWSGGNTTDFRQVIQWHDFFGGNFFCFKACDPAGANAARYCEHIYDRIGCAYNAPNNAQNNTFVSCQGDNQDFPGVYTDPSGQVQTYTQPPESLGAITTVPYTPRVPASSNCVTYTSSAIFVGLPTPSGALPSSSSGSGGSSGTRTSSTGPSNTAGGNSSNSGTANLRVGSAILSVGVGAIGVVVVVLALA